MPFVDFDGKPCSFVPGREVPNKEPAMSKFVVEKLYKVHRERIRDMEPIIDCKMEVPAFMQGNQSWKKITEEHRKEIIKMENEVIYQRIAKMENSESAMTKSSRQHKKRVESELKLMKSLKLKGRIRDFLKLQRENEDMLRRIERARPQYSLKSCKEWYKHHELFKQGRRSDHTGGHLGFTTLKGLMPKKIGAPEDKISNIDLAMNASVMMDTSVADSTARPRTTLDSRGNLPGGKKARAKYLAQEGSFVNGEANKYARSVLESRGNRAKSASAATFSKIEAQNSMFDLDETKALGGPQGNLGSDGTTPQGIRSGGTRPPSSGDRPKKKRNNADKPPTSPITTPKKPGSARSKQGRSGKKNVPLESEKSPLPDKRGADGGEGKQSDSPDGALNMPTSLRSSLDDNDEEETGIKVLYQRPFTIPFQSVGCIIQVLIRQNESTKSTSLIDGEEDRRDNKNESKLTTKGSEDFVIRAISNTMPRQIYRERVIPIDDVYSLLNDESSSSSMIQTATDGGDLVSLRALLISMFKEVDDDGNGYLTYDEFEMLMEKVELGIQPSELRYVIQEADENENGVVEFEEFVPLAVDMIQSFRALNRAKITCAQRDSLFEEEVRAKMETYDFEKLAGICMNKLHEHDPKQYGVMRVSEFKRCLAHVAYAAELSESSISIIVHKLPVDSFGRLLYNGLRDVMEKVKFMELKNELVHEHASRMQEELFKACRKAEMSHIALEGDSNGAVGLLSETIITNILANCDYNLSRLQICVLLVAGKNAHGDVDYVQFLPIAAKAIEYMFEPKALRQRAELIEKTDLDSGDLLQAAITNVDSFVQKFKGLFASCDVDHSGMMGLDEFLLCIKALEFELSDEEIEAYWSSISGKSIATSDEDGIIEEISFAKACDFLRENILSMERKKKNRQLTKTLHSTVLDCNMYSMTDEQIEKKKLELKEKLQNLFYLSDEDNTGFVTNNEMHRLLASLDMDITDVELEVIVSEADRMDGDEDGLIDYKLFLPTCIDLLMTYLARRASDEQEGKDREYAWQQADKIVKSSTDEIMQIASYIRTRLVVIDEGVRSEDARYTALHEMLHDFHSGLTKTEAQAVHDHFMNEIRRSGAEENMNKLVNMQGANVKRSERHKSHEHQMEDNLSSMSEEKGGGDGISLNREVSPFNQPSSPSSSAKSASGKGKKNRTSYLTKDQMRKNKKDRLAATATILHVQQKTNLKKDLGELIDLVTKVRKASVIRNIMRQVNPGTCSKLVLNRLIELREKLIEKGEVDIHSIYVPVKVCYAALKGLQELRLSQPQILSIISWAECYDKSGYLLDYQRFAEHAAKVIVKLFSPETLMARAHILSGIEDLETSVMQGLSKADLSDYLLQVMGGRDHLTMPEFIAILQEVPLIKISKKEAVAAASSHHDIFDAEDRLGAETIIELTYDMLARICRERFVERRIALHIVARKENTAHMDELKKLAEKFIDFVKVRPIQTSVAPHSLKPQSGFGSSVRKLEITLTSDVRKAEEARKKQKAQQEALESSHEQLGHGIEATDMDEPRIPLLHRDNVKILVVPRFTKEEKDHNLRGSGNATSGGRKNRHTVRKSPLKAPDQKAIKDLHNSIPASVEGTLNIVAVEQDLSMDRNLEITLSISRGEYSATAKLESSVKLPMLCATEKSLAVEFVKGLVPKLRVSMTSENDSFPLIVLSSEDTYESGLENDLGTLFDTFAVDDA